MKRPIAPLLLLGILLIFLVGSSNASSFNSSYVDPQLGLTGGNSYIDCPKESATTPVLPPKGPITLTVSGWASSPAEYSLVQANLNRFQQAHPTIQIRWTPFLGNDYPAKMQNNFASGTMPDVFYLQPRMVPEYVADGKLLDLSPYMARDKVAADSYYFINTFSCKTGQVYGIPKDFNTLGLFYNKKLFQQAGVAFPTKQWAWGDMRSAAKKLTRMGSAAQTTYGSSQNIYGITLPDSSSRWLAFLFANGGSVMNADGTRAAFNNAAGVDALNFYTGFQREDRSSVLASSIVPQWAGDVFDAFGQQRAAMVIEGGWLIQYLHDNYPKLRYDIAPLPVGPTGKRADLIYTNAWAAYSHTKYPEAAWELIQYMTGQEVQRSQLENGFALPSLKMLANDSYFNKNPDSKVLFDAAQQGGYPDSYGPYDLLIHQRLDLAIASVLSGQTDAQDALDNAARQINKVLKT